MLRPFNIYKSKGLGSEGQGQNMKGNRNHKMSFMRSIKCMTSLTNYINKAVKKINSGTYHAKLAGALWKAKELETTPGKVTHMHAASL